LGHRHQNISARATVVQKIFSFSGSALSEMVVRGERETLKRRFRDVLLLTASFGVFVGVSLAVCNGAFLAVWLKPGSRLQTLKIFLPFRHGLKRTRTRYQNSFGASFGNDSPEAVRKSGTNIVAQALSGDLNEYQ